MTSRTMLATLVLIFAKVFIIYTMEYYKVLYYNKKRNPV